MQNFDKRFPGEKQIPLPEHSSSLSLAPAGLQSLPEIKNIQISMTYNIFNN